MSIWICRPSLVEWNIDVGLGCAGMSCGSLIKDITDIGLKVGNAQLLDADSIVAVDTENVQKSLYDAFCNSGWETGESFNFGQNDIFEIEEYDKYFDVYVNDKLIAKFYKDRKFR